MVINLGNNYGPGSIRKKTEKKDQKIDTRISPELLKFIKVAIALSAIIVVYLVLFSKIIDYRTETILWSELYENFKDWKAGSQPVVEKGFVEEEAELVNADKEFAASMSGFILLQVEAKGEAWYVNPVDGKKYFLGSPEQAYSILRKLGESTTNSFIMKYTRFPEETAGKVILDAEDIGKAYYIHPGTRRAHNLFNIEDAAVLMKEQGVGISNEDLRKIPVGYIESVD